VKVSRFSSKSGPEIKDVKHSTSDCASDSKKLQVICPRSNGGVEGVDLVSMVESISIPRIILAGVGSEIGKTSVTGRLDQEHSL
jgi:hypothetical protein